MGIFPLEIPIKSAQYMILRQSKDRQVQARKPVLVLLQNQLLDPEIWDDRRLYCG